jgi:hypothetical protein
MTTTKLKTFADTDTIQVLKSPTYREGTVRQRCLAIFAASKTVGDARKALDAAGLPRSQLTKRFRDGVIAVAAAPTVDNRAVEETVITINGAPAVEPESPAVETVARVSKPKRQRKPADPPPARPAKKARAAPQRRAQ